MRRSQCHTRKLGPALGVGSASRPTGPPRISLVHRAEHSKSALWRSFFVKAHKGGPCPTEFRYDEDWACKTARVR